MDDNESSSELILKSKDSKFHITLPKDWIKFNQISQLNPAFSLGAAHNKNEFFGIVDEKKSGFR